MDVPLSYPGRLWTSWWMYVAVFVIVGFICITGSRACPKECRDCGPNGQCLKCTAGHFGANCTPCSPRCKFRLCVPGKCNDGCVDGWYGSYCDKNCTHCPKGCDVKGRCLREEEPEPEAKPETEHHIFIGFMCFAALGVLAIIGVFIAEKKYPYTRCRLISVLPKTKKTYEVSETVPTGEIIWRYAQELDSAQGTSNVPPRTSSSDVRVVPEMEQTPLMHAPSDVRIVVLPPTPTRSGDRRTDAPVSRHSLFPSKGKSKNKVKNKVQKPT